MLLPAPAPPGELVGQCIQVFLPDVGDDGGDALAGERRGDLTADAPARTGDDGNLALEVDLHARPPLPPIASKGAGGGAAPGPRAF